MSEPMSLFLRKEILNDDDDDSLYSLISFFVTLLMMIVDVIIHGLSGINFLFPHVW